MILVIFMPDRMRLFSSVHLQAVQKVSARLKKTFLSAGSAIPPAQLFREFRGEIVLD